MTEQFGAVKIKRTRRTTAGKSKYINFAQDSKGRIVSWGYWGKNKTLGDFAEKLKRRGVKKGGAKLKLIITIKYDVKSRPNNFFGNSLSLGEIHIDTEYPIKGGDMSVIKSFVESRFKDNRDLIGLGIKAIDDWVGKQIPFNKLGVSIVSHDIDYQVDSISVDAKVWIRGRDKTTQLDLSALKLFVETELEEII